MMAKYIMDCLSLQKMILFSWGFNSPVALNDGLQFNVEGFVFQGVIQVKYDEGKDLFYINFLKNNEIEQIIPDVYIDELIDTLDRNIEKNVNDEEYRKIVNQKYS